MADGSEGEAKRIPLLESRTFPTASKGPLMLFYKVGPSPSRWWGMLLTSKDGGKTWGNRRKLGRKDDKIGHLIGPVKKQADPVGQRHYSLPIQHGAQRLVRAL